MSSDLWIAEYENIAERVGDDLHCQDDVRTALRELGIWGQEADDHISMILEDHPDLPEHDEPEPTMAQDIAMLGENEAERANYKGNEPVRGDVGYYFPKSNKPTKAI